MSSETSTAPVTDEAAGGGAGVTSGAAVRPADIEEAVQAQRATFESGRTRDVEWRVRQLRALERLLEDTEREIAQALWEDLGRPYGEAWLGDIASTKAEARFARKRVRKWSKRHRTRVSMHSLPGRAWYQYEPLGLVLIIGPWNYPIYLSLGPLVAALAAGNCAVVKPSEYAPACSGFLARMLPRYLDSDAVVVTEGDADVTQRLLACGFDHAFFTGGTEIGRRIMSAAAPHLTPVTLELGGKSPVIVTRHADVDVAARRVAWMKLMNSGQTCIAPDYVLVDGAIRDRFVGALTDAMREFASSAGGGTLRIVNERQFDRLATMLEGTDGEIVLGGRTDRSALGIEPTVVVDPDPDSGVMSSEIFGPILPVLGTDSLDDAVSFVNERPKPLACYLFSDSTGERDRVLDRVSSGGVVVNHVAMHCLEPHLPFGGVGDSGIGAYHGKWGFERLSHRKAVLTKPARPDPSIMYPPYSRLKLAVLRRFL
ncbi:aldehyde dehydrogenase family protein [Haloechinothrix sp. YIM 98757]|uniref:Aldehyde dehydrogenase n=1 Tax=Haloechinothrix aidingensis TaxID=2752311 RepID=A0A838AC75_9PSEU|nr:aldehyde dehydrogenase family protein [Haloechinothrix aidingensis]